MRPYEVALALRELPNVAARLPKVKENEDLNSRVSIWEIIDKLIDLDACQLDHKTIWFRAYTFIKRNNCIHVDQTRVLRVLLKANSKVNYEFLKTISDNEAVSLWLVAYLEHCLTTNSDNLLPCLQLLSPMSDVCYYACFDIVNKLLVPKMVEAINTNTDKVFQLVIMRILKNISVYMGYDGVHWVWSTIKIYE